MNAKKLLDKYIKYNSKITFDIFKLMYQKLNDLGFTSPNNVKKAFEEFSGDYPYFVMKLYSDKPYFNQYSCHLIEQSKTSVEDLLGYNPFESFKLPEKWCIKVQEMKNTPEEIVNWRLKIVMCGTWVSPGYLNNHGYHSTKINQEYTELTLEQFKQYVLKEPLISKPIKPFPTHWCIELNKETIPIVGVYYNKKHLSDPKCDTYTGDGAIGCYVRSHNDENEYVKNGYTNCSFIGDPSDLYPEITLEQFKAFVMNEPVKIETISESKVEEVVPEYAVECKTQEEWDFACDKYNKPSSTKKDFPKFNTFDYTFKFTGWFTSERYIQKGYQILSFQEWCDLNGYKMTKTRFKKGDYVVSLRPKHLSTSYIKHNYCYIQDEDNNTISIGDATMYEEDPHYARLATPEEIEEYKRIGQPYDVTTLQSPTINTYGLNVGDKLDAIIIAAWEKKGCNYFSSSTEEWIFGNGAAYDRNRKIENFKVIDGVVGFLVSGTLGIYLRAEGFKEFADNYYTEIASNFKVGSWYKYNGYYLKYSKTDNRNIFIASEYIKTEDNSFKDDLIDFTCGNADGSKELVTDLSEIQQYLPAGHPDLISTVNKEVKDISKTFTVRVTSREVKRINI